MSLATSPLDALKQAIQIAGSQSALARALRVSQHAVWHWLNKGDLEKPLPADYVLAVEEATGISRYDLRPDIYPREEAAGDALEGVRP